jgi:hypothetical protein
MGFQKPQQLLKTQKNQVFWQWEFCGLFAWHRLPGATAVAAGMERPSLLACVFCYPLKQWEQWGLLMQGHGFFWCFSEG